MYRLSDEAVSKIKRLFNVPVCERSPHEWEFTWLDELDQTIDYFKNINASDSAARLLTTEKLEKLEDARKAVDTAIKKITRLEVSGTKKSPFQPYEAILHYIRKMEIEEHSMPFYSFAPNQESILKSFKYTIPPSDVWRRFKENKSDMHTFLYGLDLACEALEDKTKKGRPFDYIEAESFIERIGDLYRRISKKRPPRFPRPSSKFVQFIEICIHDFSSDEFDWAGFIKNMHKRQKKAP